MQKDKNPTELYRHYNAADELLYVGISLASVARLMQHKRSSSWFGRVTKITIEHYPTRTAALKAEQAAIKSEKPKHNISHAGPRPPPPKESVTRSRRDISDRIVSLKPVYSLYEVSTILGVSLTTMIQMTEDGDIGYIDLPKARLNGREKRGITGWQLLEYIDHLHSEAEQRNGRMGRRGSPANRPKRERPAVQQRRGSGGSD